MHVIKVKDFKSAAPSARPAECGSASYLIEKDEDNMKKFLRGDALEQRARELGVDTQGGPIT